MELEGQVICPETSTVISTDSNPEEPKVSQERQTVIQVSSTIFLKLYYVLFLLKIQFEIQESDLDESNDSLPEQNSSKNGAQPLM